jgi:hypothetical protein
MTFMARTEITAENIDAAREALPRDQAAQLAVGCVTWGVLYEPGQQRGQVTVWPDADRAAVALGGDSIWCSVQGGRYVAEDGTTFDAAGREIEGA